MIELTEKQEKFVRSYVEGMNQTEAYRNAYDAEKSKDSTVWENASRLMADSKVAARIQELRKPAADKAQLTLSTHLTDLKAIRNRAFSEGKYGAAVQAETVRGKAAGLHVDKLDVEGDLIVEIVRFGKEKNHENSDV